MSLVRACACPVFSPGFMKLDQHLNNGTFDMEHLVPCLQAIIVDLRYSADTVSEA